MPWRVVLGHHLTALPQDENGVWRSPDGEFEALLHPRVSPYDPARHGVADAMRAAGWDGADAYVHWTPEYAPLPLDAPYAVPRVCAVWGDWNVAGRALRLLRDVLAAAVVDLPGVEALRRAGYERVAAVLPWGWDSTTSSHPVEARREIDVLFAGRRNSAIHGERERWLVRLERLRARHRVDIVSGVSPEEFQTLLRRAKLVFNRSVRGEANMRAFEGAAQGACVLGERGNRVLDAVFGEDVGYASYDDDLETVVDRLLSDEHLRLGIAREGQRIALQHSYDSHLVATLRTLRDLCGDDPPPGSPDPLVWREIVAEQWRLTGRRLPEALTELLPSFSVEAAARRLALEVETEPAGSLAAAREAIAVGTRQDAPFLLALAESAVALGSSLFIQAAQYALAAPASGTFIGVPTPDYGDWRLALETAVLEAADDGKAADAADCWVRTRAAWILACAVAEQEPATALALVDGLADELAPVLFLRGRLRCRVGRRQEGLADLERLARSRPTDPTAVAALAEALSPAAA